MRKCPRCGFANLSDASFCAMCARPMAEELKLGGEGGAIRRAISNLATGSLAPWRARLERAMELLARPPAEGLEYRPPMAAAAASILPGAGQCWNGQVLLGAIHFAIFAALLSAGVVLIVSPWSDLLFLAAFLTATWSMSHAAIGARIVNGGANFSERQARWKMFFLLVGLAALGLWFVQYVAAAWLLVAALTLASFADLAKRENPATGRAARALLVWGALGAWGLLGWACWSGPHWLWRSMFRIHAHGQVAFAPFIRRNDRILFEGISVAWRPIQLGDIVLYDPDRYKAFTLTRDSMAWDGAVQDLDMVNMETNIERVIGLPGDLIERRGGVFYRNGEPAPPLFQPLVQNDSPDDFALPKVPPGHYAILFSYGPIEWAPLAEVKGHLSVRKAAPPAPFGDLERLSIVPADKIFGRALMIHHPWSRRRWIDGAIPESRPTKRAPTPKEWTMDMLKDG